MEMDLEDNVSWIDLLNSFSVSISSKVRDQVQVQGRKLKPIKEIAISSQTRGSKQYKQFATKTTRYFKNVDKMISHDMVVSKTEKVWYTASLLFLLFIGWVLSLYPERLHQLYTLTLAILLPIRFFTYYRRNFHYYLADLCYFVNALLLLFIWVYPESSWLWHSCFSFSFGTLSFAIITWRNSLVLHSIDKTTSTIIHIMPPLVCHTLTHRLPLDFKSWRFSGIVPEDNWQIKTSILCTTIAYFTWQSLYHYFITWRKRSKIEAGQVTSFEFLRKAYKDTWLGKFVNSLPGPLPVTAFTMIQFSYQMGTMIPCPIWYKNRALSALFLMVIFACAAYNGATYYIDFYGNRFRKEMLKAQQELDEMIQSIDQLTHAPDFEQEEQIVRDTVAHIRETTAKRNEAYRKQLP